MKKLVLFFATALFFLACQKENTVTPVIIDDQDDTTHVVADTVIQYDTLTHVYDTTIIIVDTATQVHISVSEILTRTYVTDAGSDNKRAMGFEISFVLNSDGEIYFDKDQFREIVGIPAGAYTEQNIYSFISGDYVIDNNGLYKIQKNQPQYITFSKVISRDTSAAMMPVSMSVPVFDYRVKNGTQFKAQTKLINAKTVDVMF